MVNPQTNQAQDLLRHNIKKAIAFNRQDYFFRFKLIIEILHKVVRKLILIHNVGN